MNKLPLLLLLAAPPIWAQDVPPPPQAEEDEAEEVPEEVVVTGRREPGAVVGDIPPIDQLRPADIRSYGVGTVSELIAELGPQVRSGRGGAPVVLLNGRRVSGFGEIRDLPTEAILRVDILPEEVALKYGYRADQRVVNVVLRRRFRAVTGEVADRIATEGGRNAGQGSADLLTIRGPERVNLHLDARRSSALTEDERDLVGRGEPFRTLLPENRTVAANAVYARELGDVAATVNGELAVSDTLALFGEGADGALRQDARDITGRLGTTLNGDIGRWRWTLTGAYDRSDSRTFTDVEGAAPNQAYSTSQRGSSGRLLLNGSAFTLPAGEASASVRVGASTSDLESRSVRLGVERRGEVSRDLASAQGNIDLPVASRGRDVLAWAGQLSVNANVGVERLSDFGTLTSYGYGLNWSPIDAVRVVASVVDEENAPTAAQLGNPQITTPGVRVFDYLRGETVAVDTLTGGNPGLRASGRRAERVGLTVRPWSARDLSIQVDYNRVRVDDPVAGFPAATAAIASAFPGRFTRDADGRLVALDARAVNFARSDRSELRWGADFSKPLRSRVQRQLEAFRAGTGPDPFAGLRPPGGRRERPEGSGSGGRGGGRGGFGGRGGGGRAQVALFHTVRLTDRVLVAEGGPTLDLLRGDAIGNNGGQPRHEVEAQAGYTNDGLGARLSVNWRSGTTVEGGTAAAPTRLAFGSLATANLRLFADLGQRPDWVRKHPWMRGMRVTVGVENLLNDRQRVRDAAGLTPVNFQPGLLDPLGRSIRLSVRKLFL